MRVLMIAPDTEVIDRRILQQARSLREAGHDVVLCSGFECGAEQHSELDGIEIHRFAYDWDDPRLRRLRARLPANERLQRVVNRCFMGFARRFLPVGPFDAFVLEKAGRYRADVVHVHDLPLLRHGARLARSWGTPLVFDAHEIYHEQETLPATARRRLRRAERRLLPHVDVFFTVNAAIAEWYETRYGRRPLVLHNSVPAFPIPDERRARAFLRDRLGLGSEVRVVLYQGWISAERNLETLVRSAEHLPHDVHLAVIGYGDHTARLQELAASAPFGRRVHFPGRQEPERLLEFTAGADVGVIPYLPIDLNHRLCSPNKFFEYVQSGVPVVAHELPFFEAMRDAYGVAVLGDLSEPRGMARAIRLALDDAGRWTELRRACLRAAPELAWEREAEQLVAAYGNLEVAAP